MINVKTCYQVNLNIFLNFNFMIKKICSCEKSNKSNVCEVTLYDDCSVSRKITEVNKLKIENFEEFNYIFQYFSNEIKQQCLQKILLLK